MEVKIGISIPKEVLYIINVFNSSGFEAYIVGGCVRDSIMGKVPKDWDITTNARPEETEELFDKTISTGIKHGTVTIVLNSQNFEVTTYRIDGEYADNRRPETVEFTSSLIDDLGRRDFTINAIAYHPDKGFADPFNGMSDIEDGTIRAVGQPEKRFGEDALRMLRAIRFSAQLNFNIENNTLKAVKACSSSIVRISSERVREELTGTIVSDNPFKFTLLEDTGLLHFVLPEFEPCFHIEQKNPYHIYNVAVHTLHTVSHIDKNRILRWAMLLHDSGKAMTKTTDENNIDHFYGHPDKSMKLAEKALKRLKFDNKSIDTICKLVKYHDRPVEATPKSVRKAIIKIGEDYFPDFLKVKEADMKGQNPEYLGDRLEDLKKIREIYYNIIESQQCLSLKKLAIDGNDLMALGFAQNRELGKLLNQLLNAVIAKPELNNREDLIMLAKRFSGGRRNEKAKKDNA